MTHADSINLAIWIAGILMLGFLCLGTWKRGLHREFPIFYCYLVFHFVDAAVGLWVFERFSINVSWYVLWGGDALDGPFSLALIYEIFSKSLHPYDGLQKLGRSLFFVGTIGLSCLAIWIALSDSHSFVQRLNSAVISMDRSVDFTKLALLFLLFGVHRFLGLNWRHYLFGIALGFSVSSSVDLLAQAVRLQLGMSWARMFSYVDPMSYNIGLCIWVYYVLSKESKVRVSAVPYSAHLTKWNAALQEILSS